MSPGALSSALPPLRPLASPMTPLPASTIEGVTGCLPQHRRRLHLRLSPRGLQTAPTPLRPSASPMTPLVASTTEGVMGCLVWPHRRLCLRLTTPGSGGSSLRRALPRLTLRGWCPAPLSFAIDSAFGFTTTLLRASPTSSIITGSGPCRLH